MKIKVCKSWEISEAEWEAIIEGFVESFSRPSSAERMKHFYSNNLFGFSYHALAVNEDEEIIGHSTVIPYYYDIRGKTYIIGLISGTFIRKQYRRNVIILKEMQMELSRICNSEKMVAFIGVPNENAYKYNLKILKMKHIGNLNYYVIPVRLSNLLNGKLPTFINSISLTLTLVYAFSLTAISKIINPIEKELPIALKITPDFLNVRFKYGYNSFTKNGISFFLKIENEKGINIAYLMEFNNKGIQDFKALSKAICYIIKNYKVDVIGYIGKLTFHSGIFLKIPRYKEPKSLPLTGEILPYGKSIINEALFFEMKNWKFGLINLDVK